MFRWQKLQKLFTITWLIKMQIANSACSRKAKVNGDDAWQKRAYLSLNGVLTLISDGKCIDTEVLSKKCKQCEQWEHRKDTDQHSHWKEKHICAINQIGSAGAMEVFFLNMNMHLQLKIKKTKKNIHQASRHLRMPGTNLKTIKFNSI